MVSGETDCVGAVSLTISAMEDDGSLNAGEFPADVPEDDAQTYDSGYGSNLNMDGFVECDASIHAGVDGAFGGVTAVSGKPGTYHEYGHSDGYPSGIKNPIIVAQKLLEQSRIPPPMGIVPPL